MTRTTLSQKVADGVVGMSIAVVVGRLTTFVAQLALGWLLTKEDYSLYALSVGTSSFILALGNGGAGKVLIQRGEDYQKLARPVAEMAWLFNAVGAALLILASFWAVDAYDAPVLYALLGVTALSLLLGTPAALGRAAASIRLEFRAMATVEAIASFGRQALVVLLAFLGFGALSFVLPLLAIAVFEWVAFRRIIGAWPVEPPLTLSKFFEIFRDSRWILLSTLAAALVLQGDYFVIGALAERDVLATYFFGYQLTAAVSTVFTSGLMSVILPAFSTLNSDPERQARGYARAVGVLALVASLLGTGVAAVAEPLIHLAWNGKWDGAIPVVQLMALSLCLRVLVPVGRSLFEARGHFRLQTILLGVDALGTLCFAGLGCLWGDVTRIALCVALHRILFSCFQIQLAGKLLRLPAASTLTRSLVPFAVFGVAAGLTIFFSPASLRANPFLQLAVHTLAFLCLAAVFGGLFLRGRFVELFALRRRRRGTGDEIAAR